MQVVINIIGGTMEDMYKNCVVPTKSMFSNSETSTWEITEGVRTKAVSYVLWSNIKTRVSCPRYQKSRPRYKGTLIYTPWLDYGNFKRWYDEHGIRGLTLDKDLKSGVIKCYSPKTCLFVSCVVNSYVLSAPAKKSRFPRGVSFSPRGSIKPFLAKLHRMGKTIHLGTWWTEEEAHLAYLAAKIEYGCEILKEQTGEVHKYLKIFIKNLERRKSRFEKLVLDKSQE